MKIFFVKLALVFKLNGVKKSAICMFLLFVFFSLNIFFKADLNKYFKLFNAIIINPVLIVAMFYYRNKERKDISVKRMGKSNQLPAFFFLLAAICLFIREFSGRLPLICKVASAYLFVFFLVLGISSWLWTNRVLFKQIDNQYPEL